MWESVGISAIITTLLAVLFGVIFIVGVDLWAPELHQLRQYAFPYLLFLAASSIVLLTGDAFIVLKKTKTTLKATFAIFLLLIPAVIVLYFSGELVFELLGKDYAAVGLNLLRLMVLSSFFVGIYQIYSSIKRIQKDMKGLILLGALIFVLLLGLSYTFMPKLGLLGVGYAWMISYGVSSVVVAVFAKSGR